MALFAFIVGLVDPVDTQKTQFLFTKIIQDITIYNALECTLSIPNLDTTNNNNKNNSRGGLLAAKSLIAKDAATTCSRSRLARAPLAASHINPL